MQQLGWHNLQNWVSLYWTHGSCPLITSCSRDRCSTISIWAAHHDSWALLLFSFSLIYLWSLSKTIILLVRFFIMLHVALYRTDMIWYIYIYMLQFIFNTWERGTIYIYIYILLKVCFGWSISSSIWVGDCVLLFVVFAGEMYTTQQ